MLRNGEQLLLAVVIPLLVLVTGSFALDRMDLPLADSPINVLVPGVIALAVMSTSFTSLAIATGFERRAGLLRRLAVSPLSRSGLLAGKIGAVLLVQAFQVVLIAMAGLLLGWRPSAAGVLLMVPVAVIGAFAFASLGLLLAGTVRSEATLAIANLVNLLLMFGGAIVLPASVFGDSYAWVQFLPSAALGDAMRGAALEGHLAGAALLTLALWGLIGAAAVGRWFRWD